jgi:predicted nucleic acid-binding protein
MRLMARLTTQTAQMPLIQLMSGFIVRRDMLGKVVLVDSDALIGLQIIQDDHHQTAVDVFAKIRARGIEPVVTNYVISETTNYLSKRYSLSDAKYFLQNINQFKTILIDINIHRASVALFYEQTNGKTSLVDMANVIVMKHLHIPHIFAFDKVYERDFGLSNLTEKHT